MNTAFVTGGSSGIGLSTCLKFLEMGWRVVSISRNPPMLDNCIHIKADLAQEDFDVTAIEELLEDCQGNIALIHNAAQHKSDTAHHPSLDYLTDLFTITIKSAARLNAIFSDYLNEGSSIIYVGSTLSEIGVPNNFSYVTMKHAVTGMMKATQQDFSERKVHSCCVCPGVTATPMASDSGKFTEDFFNQRVSLGRYIEPDEIANVIYFCATNPALNGSVLHANLGQINS